MSVNQNLNTKLLRYQQNEITDHLIYLHLAKRVKQAKDKALLEKIASDEATHYQIYKTFTNQDVKANPIAVLWAKVLGFIFGYTFVLQLSEKKEASFEADILLHSLDTPEIESILKQESEHEQALIALLAEERLDYVADMVLGLNDALVELTGTIAGLTFALTNTKLVALSALITGISATLSMAASNYLAQKAADNPNALKSCFYTGAAYVVTVALMVTPYLLFPDDMYLWAFVVMITIVVLIILLFNYYIATAKALSFKKRFLEMVTISLSVALVSFLIGLIAKQLLGVEV
ncbi:MAG: VIT1/CCC1 transporter family protein [Erysipelotrichaceae bacterium]|jgi:VIT1/CCC1 family predicted Fe2+/Mn2+ transporter|nr:VIT1/CCC1 transporter family protein [Erysipelotrichaceae bacterium]